MRTGYIDTSFLLSILFEDEQCEKSIDVWNSLDFRYSSVLLDIEARINLYKYKIRKKTDNEWSSRKERELSDLLSNITRKMVDNEINLEIKNNDVLKRPRSLDSIHLATAGIFNKLINEKILLCSYDREMLNVGKSLGFELIDI